MSGENIVGELMRADVALTALVTAESIKIGRLPDDVTLPALLVNSVSRVERVQLKPGATTYVVERIAVTVRARSVRERNDVLDLVRSCCRGVFAGVAGIDRAVIRTAGAGPGLNGPGNSFERTQDFRVSFEEPS